MTELPILVVSACAYWSRDAKAKWEKWEGVGGVSEKTIVLESEGGMVQGMVGDQQLL